MLIFLFFFTSRFFSTTVARLSLTRAVHFKGVRVRALLDTSGEKGFRAAAITGTSRLTAGVMPTAPVAFLEVFGGFRDTRQPRPKTYIAVRARNVSRHGFRRDSTASFGFVEQKAKIKKK